eukprot:6176828-Pleurochrysis_carterae.AAC.2
MARSHRIHRKYTSPRSNYAAAATPRPPQPSAAASSSNMAKIKRTVDSPRQQVTPDSEKVMVRRHRMFVGAQMCEPTAFRAEQIAGLGFDIEESKLLRKRKARTQ